MLCQIKVCLLHGKKTVMKFSSDMYFLDIRNGKIVNNNLNIIESKKILFYMFFKKLYLHASKPSKVVAKKQKKNYPLFISAPSLFLGLLRKGDCLSYIDRVKFFHL